MLDTFHFLRPWWLLALPAGLLISWMVWQLRDTRSQWRGVIAPHLLDALMVRAEHRRRLVPVHLLLIVTVIAPLALAGPTWQREPSPFAVETAALVIVVDAGASMLAEDVPPSRQERASQKIADLLKAKSDTDTALIAYAGSAHVAMPLTRDTSIVEEFSRSLSVDVMPREGDALAEAIALANKQLEQAGRTGSILLISDGTTDSEVRAIQGMRSVPVHVLSMSTGPIPDTLEAVAGETSGSLTAVTADSRDVQILVGRVQHVIAQAAETEGAGRWRDAGYYLLPVIALLTLFWSRKGWAVAYSGLVTSGGGT